MVETFMVGTGAKNKEGKRKVIPVSKRCKGTTKAGNSCPLEAVIMGLCLVHYQRSSYFKEKNKKHKEK